MDKQYLKKSASSGFTLSEVLITLAIIGIVAALTIPSIVTKIQDAQHKAAWKRAFATASQAYQLAVDDNGGNGFGGYLCGIPSNMKLSFLMDHLKVVKTCNGNAGGNCWPTNGASYPDGSYPPDGACDYFDKNYQINNDYAFVTADGMRWLTYGNPYTIGWICPIVMVDINGANGPNYIGVDVFVFTMLDRSLQAGAGCGWTPNSQNYLLQ